MDQGKKPVTGHVMVLSKGQELRQITDPQAMVPSAPTGTLLAAIVPEGEPAASSNWFVVGSTYSATVPASGRLYLLYNDSPSGYTDNSGSYEVAIAVTTA